MYLVWALHRSNSLLQSVLLVQRLLSQHHIRATHEQLDRSLLRRTTLDKVRAFADVDEVGSMIGRACGGGAAGEEKGCGWERDGDDDDDAAGAEERYHCRSTSMAESTTSNERRHSLGSLSR
jgi:hypothetical protein